MDSTNDSPACSCPLGLECTSPAKHPLSHAGFFERGLNDCTTDASVIRRAWSMEPSANVAVVMRESSLVAFDIDVYHGDEAKLAELIKIYGPLPETLSQVSGSREGRHLMYRIPLDPETGEPMRCRGVLGGVVIRARAYCVVAPSQHKSGHAYEWLPGASPLERGPAELPASWIAALKPDKPEGAIGAPPPDQEPEWLRAIPAATRSERAAVHLAREKGERKGIEKAGTTFDVIRSVARGFALRDPAHVAELVRANYNAKCVPPWPEEAVDRLAWTALNRAHTPEWGCHLMPDAMRLAQTLDDLGISSEEAAQVVQVASAPREVIPALVTTPAEPISRAELLVELRAAQRRLSRSTDPVKILDGDLLRRAMKGAELSDHLDEAAQARDAVMTAMARHAPRGATPEQIAEILMASLPGETPGEIAAAINTAREVTRPASRRGPVLPADPDKPPPATDEELRARLTPGVNGEGVRGSGPNIEMILRYSQATKGQIRFNVLTKTLEVSGGALHGFPIDVMDVALKNWLGREWTLFASTTEVTEQLTMVARTWWGYDPVAEYLRGVKWDGVPRIGGPDSASWLTTYCGADDTSYARKVGSRFLISAVARALDPGCKVDTVLVLEGEQGERKSSTLAALGGDWFSDTPIDIGNKDSRMLAASKWIVELAELSSLSAGEVESHKAFLSSKCDDFRPPYGRTIVSFERRCVFAGSTNAEEYLRDPTGARRFWAVRVHGCQVARLRQDRDQIWAEAVARYEQACCEAWQRGVEADAVNPVGERWWFEPHEQNEADEEIEGRNIEDAWAPLIAAWVDGQSRPGTGAGVSAQHTFTLAEIASGALQMGPADLPRHQIKLAASCRAAGLVQRRSGAGQRRLRVWMRKGAEVIVPASGDAPPRVLVDREDNSRGRAN